MGEDKTMSLMTHTPLPWEFIIGESNSDTDNCAAGIIAYDDGGRWHIAKLWDDCPGAQANTEFIVRACNNHYKLLGALERIEKLGHGDGHGCGYSCAEIAKAAIKEAVE